MSDGPPEPKLPYILAARSGLCIASNTGIIFRSLNAEDYLQKEIPPND